MFDLMRAVQNFPPSSPATHPEGRINKN